MTFQIFSKASALALAALLMTGCDLVTGKGGVAVIDLDAVAQAVGRDKAITDQVQTYAKDQEAKLVELKAQLEQQVTTAAEKVKKEASDEDKQAVTALVLEARNQLSRELNQARQSAQQLRQQLVRDFAVEMQPLARRAADKRGLTVVMVKQPGMLVVSPEADITNDVIDMLQASEAPVAPALPEQSK